MPATMATVILPLVVVRGRAERATPVDDRATFRTGDRVMFLVYEPKETEATAWLREQGWEPEVTAPPAPHDLL